VTSYERIYFTPDARTAEGPDRPRPSVLLEIASEGDKWLTGYEVNREGERIEPKGADERLHLIDKTTIARRVPMQMNLHYGELEAQRS
jgi:hypothetical protein